MNAPENFESASHESAEKPALEFSVKPMTLREMEAELQRGFDEGRINQQQLKSGKTEIEQTRKYMKQSWDEPDTDNIRFDVQETVAISNLIRDAVNGIL